MVVPMAQAASSKPPVATAVGRRRLGWYIVVWTPRCGLLHLRRQVEGRVLHPPLPVGPAHRREDAHEDEDGGEDGDVDADRHAHVGPSAAVDPWRVGW